MRCEGGSFVLISALKLLPSPTRYTNSAVLKLSDQSGLEVARGVRDSVKPTRIDDARAIRLLTFSHRRAPDRGALRRTWNLHRRSRDVDTSASGPKRGIN